MKIKFICEECGKVFSRNISVKRILTAPQLYGMNGVIAIEGTVKCSCGSERTFAVSKRKGKYNGD